MKKLAVSLLLVFFICSPVIADVVEITIEYGDSDCTENWSCNTWSSCVGGTQTRTCTDLSGCGTIFNKPSESQTCSPGGGGGGGGAPTTEDIHVGDVTVSEPEVEVHEDPGKKESEIMDITLIVPSIIESGEPFKAEVRVKSTTNIAPKIKLLGKEKTVELKSGEEQLIVFEVNAPEGEGNYKLTVDGFYETDSKNIYLEYKPLFLYVNPVSNWTYELHLKNFDESLTTEIQVIKDSMSTVYFDYLYGKIDYKTNLTFSPGKYQIVAKAMSGVNVIDEDVRLIEVEGDSQLPLGWILLIMVVLIIIISTYFILKK